MKKQILFCISAIVLLCAPLLMQGQYLRGSYYMDGSSTRLALNPAMYPQRGFINLPVIGGTYLEMSTNALGYKDIMEYVEDENINTNNLLGKLSPLNTVDINFGTEVLSFGFHTKKNFITFGVATKVNMGIQIPKNMFEYMQNVNNETFTGEKHYDIANQKVNINAYTEVGVGFSRQINKRLTIGAKAKMLLGNANMDLNINKMQVDAYLPETDYQNSYADITTDIEFALSGKGVTFEEDQDGYIEDINIGEFGVGGYGAALDLGVNYAITDQLTVSAAVVDLGFISWSKEATTVYASKAQVHIDDNNEVDVIDFDTFGLKDGVHESRRTTLCSTVSVGAEYGFVNNKVGLGLLSTTRFGANRTVTELTAVATYRPGTMFNASVSYSMIGGYDTFGLALKLGPLMVGTDYMFLGGNSKQTNVYMGLSIPLAKKK